MINACSFIPHEKPMIFIDHLIEVNSNAAIAELVITPELLFCESQGLPTWTSIELMAQTVSAYVGYQHGGPAQKPKIGFLLGTRKLHLPLAFFAYGETVKIHIEQVYIHEGLGQFNCTITYQEYVFNATINVFEPNH
ncbi:MULTISPECIES: 3-hydroxylacyl-ACP dehydratase [unclassified Acinetobacter]|uniref:ApeP family dehydratase n=1 Tax=unclassified Acinetobacter TaxID=196816 RepID=UPI002934E2EE|nr:MULTISPECIES: 3-hydroxylacyl-ACP dehydratase [unclassified Acinetobacter]WOE31259.1 3-hydroxylacyl-ACP dehydratase [Acinetobacter sp. SAAs470]WOE39455.1 3-hydroxylacyl-ACP dehydratase [Acinetobacter sp. SAAs474]